MVAPGWRRFAFDAGLAAWVEAVRPAALAALNAQAWRAGGTWNVGVHALGNDAEGRVGAGPPLPDWLRMALNHTPLDRAQISAVRPGYPLRDSGESDASFGFRRDRDAAHLDGLLPVGPDRRRMLREPQAFLLGIALTEAGEGASPLALWEGSHRLMAETLAPVLAVHPHMSWRDVDLTEAYHAARRRVFAECKRRLVQLRIGEAVLLHRLTLHGISPWQGGAAADPEGRVIAYFRPPLAAPADWPVAGRSTPVS